MMLPRRKQIPLSEPFLCPSHTYTTRRLNMRTQRKCAPSSDVISAGNCLGKERWCSRLESSQGSDFSSALGGRWINITWCLQRASDFAELPVIFSSSVVPPNKVWYPGHFLSDPGEGNLQALYHDCTRSHIWIAVEARLGWRQPLTI